jgi:hypothetical protein
VLLTVILHGVIPSRYCARHVCWLGRNAADPGLTDWPAAVLRGHDVQSLLSKALIRWIESAFDCSFEPPEDGSRTANAGMSSSRAAVVLHFSGDDWVLPLAMS